MNNEEKTAFVICAVVGVVVSIALLALGIVIGIRVF